MTHTILISGASKGIGRATALRLAKDGHRVLAGVRSEDDAVSLRSDALGVLEPVFLDIARPASLDEFCSTHGARLDDGGLHGLVNNAGRLLPGALEFTSMEAWRDLFDVNLFGHIDLTQRMLPFLRRSRGRIVFVSSINGHVALPMGAPYCASKFAMEGLAGSLRRELHRFGVNVSTIVPGGTDTQMLEGSKASTEEAVAAIQGDGAEIYRRVGQGLIKAGAKFRGMATPPERVADAICHALVAKKPRRRYVVGKDAKALSALKAVTTDGMLDVALRKMLKI